MNWLLEMFAKLSRPFRLALPPARDLEGLSGRVTVYNPHNEYAQALEAKLTQALILRGARMLMVPDERVIYPDGVIDMSILLKDVHFVLVCHLMEQRIPHLNASLLTTDLQFTYQCVGHGEILLMKGWVGADPRMSGWVPADPSHVRELPQYLRERTDKIASLVVESLDSTSVWSRINLG